LRWDDSTPMWNWASNGPFSIPGITWICNSGGMILTARPEINLSASLPTTQANLHAKPAIRGEKPATNLLSRSTAQNVCYVQSEMSRFLLSRAPTDCITGVRLPVRSTECAFLFTITSRPVQQLLTKSPLWYILVLCPRR
jgi:hypothetical protein